MKLIFEEDSAEKGEAEPLVLESNRKEELKSKYK